MINLKQFKELVVAPALNSLNLGGDAAINLVTGTALAESGLVYLKQFSYGQALGFFQMEPATHDDIWKHFLPNKPQLKAQLQQITNHLHPEAAMMISHLAYGAAMCRIQYMRTASPLPAAADPIGMAHYHKGHYNTALGAADPAENIAHFKAAINA